MESKRLPSSFRDPGGFVFETEGRIFRHVAESARDDFDLLLSSGLYSKLCHNQMLVPHKEVAQVAQHPGAQAAYKVLEPERIPFISYPYEWCFSALKDAALLTLSAELLALEHQMTLKDASAFNVQFLGGKPILIDTLSFERYRPGQPWPAYRQFCQQFLAPLALMAYTDIQLNKLSQLYIDGIPLNLAAQLLPFKAWLSPGLSVNIMMHGQAESNWSDRTGAAKQATMTQAALKGLLSLLESTVQSLKLPARKSHWSGYYDTEESYCQKSFADKQRLVQEFLELCRPGTLWDLGANTGKFSRACAAKEIRTIALDADALSTEQNYLACKQKKVRNVLPLVVDLSCPTPAIGWACEERLSLLERGPADAALALALIHHLAIGNNVPLERIAQLLYSICRFLIVEFVPKEDPQTQSLLACRQDIFANYSQAGFEQHFCQYFQIMRKENITDCSRTIYLMEKKPEAA